MNRGDRPGLTLLELVVVLAILAVLTLVAVLSTDTVVDQGRFDVTQRALQAIDDAVLGPAGQQDAPSFVGDTGRLPLSWVDPTDATAEPQLTELWMNPNGLRAFGPSPATPAELASDAKLDSDVVLLAGWRGPYLRLNPGQTKLRDGWGNPFLFFQADGTLDNTIPVAAANLPIANVISSGGASPPYNPASITLSLPTRFDSSIWSGTVQGSVEDTITTSPGLNAIMVKLFVPDLTKTSGVRVMQYTATAATGYRFVFPVTSTIDTNYADLDNRLSVPIGPKAFRVYQTIGATTTKGPIVYVCMPQGGLTKTLYFDLQ